MQTLHGTVENTRHIVDVQSGYHYSGHTHIYNSSVHTKHIASFNLGGHRVRFVTKDPAPISDGDQLSVMGNFDRDGIFLIAAYRNATAQVAGDDGKHWQEFGVGLIATLLGPALVFIFLTLPQDLLLALPFALLALTGITVALRGLRRWRTIRSFKDARARLAPVGLRPSHG